MSNAARPEALSQLAHSPSTLAHPILTDDYATEWMGLEVLALGDGSATVATTIRREMLNGFGIAHGGMIFAIADSAFALACNPHTPEDDDNTITVAAGVDVNFLAPAHVGERITAVAERRAQTGRSGLYDVQVFATASHNTVAPGNTPAGSPPAADDGASPARATPSGTPAPRLIAEFRGRSRTIPKR
ncbi:hotdog fold thioesterase [Sinomonas sp. JGH33]|uniref:Hotdog fold thioesterase n=1 Tax=Sinomonas terricola TaxID=3110330 RepID=A0ABU5T2H6_9MICC|nr:hotdog fold thioesterase [Sinomonas sp. JGH33]MEA5453671.1 hotdog fold thioesterase [Sinomonas sp. JGH33]